MITELWEIVNVFRPRPAQIHERLPLKRAWPKRITGRKTDSVIWKTCPVWAYHPINRGNRFNIRIRFCPCRNHGQFEAIADRFSHIHGAPYHKFWKNYRFGVTIIKTTGLSGRFDWPNPVISIYRNGGLGLSSVFRRPPIFPLCRTDRGLLSIIHPFRMWDIERRISHGSFINAGGGIFLGKAHFSRPPVSDVRVFCDPY